MVRMFQRCTSNILTQIDPDALALARKLDGLPLALATAGAYLNQVSTSFSEYLRLFEDSWLKLLESSPEVDSYEDRALYTTWNLSYEHVMKQNLLSAKLLQFWAYFDNQDVWFDLLRHSDSSSPTWFSDLIVDEVEFTKAIRVLCNHALVEVEQSSEERIEGDGYSMHGCVHSWTIHVLNREWDTEMAEVALKCIGSHVPEQNAQRGWIIERRMLQHASRCSDIVSRGLISSSGLEWALDKLGSLYADMGKLVEAEAMYKRALEGYEKALGPDHTSTLGTVNNLGALYSNQGKLAEAEAMYKRALEGYEKALGANFETYMPALNTIWGLASIFERKADSAKAKILFSKALNGYEKAVGIDHLRSQQLRDKLRALDAVMENNDLKEVREPVNVIEKRY
jgi:tetratricopeptide (TPR) repeat protein